MASLDNAFVGIGNIHEIPAEQRIYGRTKEILNITRGRLPNWRVMSQKTSSRQAADDMEFKWKSDYPLQALLTLAANSSAVDGGTHNKLGFSAIESVRLREGMRIYADRNFVDATGGYIGTLVDDSYVPSGVEHSQRECIKLLTKLETTSGITYWKVQRVFGPSYTTTGTANSLTVAGGHKFLMGLAPQAIGDNSGGVYGDTPHEETNYCEITLMKFGVARTANKVKIYQNKTLLQRNTERQMEMFWKQRENNFMFGRKGLEYSSEDGSPIYATGGVDEYISTPQTSIGYSIPTDDADKESNIINFNSAFGTVNYQALNDFGKNKFYWGSTAKWWVCDDIQFTKIANSFDNKIRINYNEQMSINYGFKINDLHISGGGTFHLAVSDLFSIYGLKNTGYIIDYDYIKPVPFVDEDLTILVDVEKGMNPLKRIDYLYVNGGYERNCPFAHYKVYNM